MKQIVVGVPDGVRDPQTYAVIGAAMEVHRLLGPGFVEPVYQEALSIELSERAIFYHREVELPIHYKGVRLAHHYRADFVCYREVLVEVKALRQLSGAEDSQIINYLAASRFGRGLLLNFGTQSLEFKRFLRPRAPLLSPRSLSASSAESVDP